MATLSEARSKLVILGIGDDGLAGLTEPARRLVMGADLILAAPSILDVAGVGSDAKSRHSSRT